MEKQRLLYLEPARHLLQTRSGPYKVALFEILSSEARQTFAEWLLKSASHVKKLSSHSHEDRSLAVERGLIVMHRNTRIQGHSQNCHAVKRQGALAHRERIVKCSCECMEKHTQSYAEVASCLILDVSRFWLSAKAGARLNVDMTLMVKLLSAVLVLAAYDWAEAITFKTSTTAPVQKAGIWLEHVPMRCRYPHCLIAWRILNYFMFRRCQLMPKPSE